jgi:integrase
MDRFCFTPVRMGFQTVPWAPVLRLLRTKREHSSARFTEPFFERGTINLNPQGRQQTVKRQPVVALNDQAIEALRLAFEARQSMYVIERGAKKVASIKKAFHAASQRSGVEVTPYTLRHTAAVWMAEAGIPMSEIAQFMAHDDSATTERHYARFSPSYLRGAANSLRI